MDSSLPRLTPFATFEEACEAVLDLLHRRLGLALWMVTRVSGEDWVVLHCADHGYGVEPGTVMRWSDTLCSRMVEGLGPRVAPDLAAVPSYREAPSTVPIGAYVGVPLELHDGTLFGTLCAIDPSPQAAGLVADLGLVELLGRLLGTAAAAQASADDLARRAERAALSARADALTGLPDASAWRELLAHEEARCARLGLHAAVLAVDLQGLGGFNEARGGESGDTLIAAAAFALRDAFRGSDVVARLGGGEFGVLALGADAHVALQLRDRCELLLAELGVPVTAGCAARAADGDLEDAWHRAAADLVREKDLREVA